MISARNTEVSPRLEELVHTKVNRLERYLEGLERAEVHFFEERNPRIAEREICEITLEGHGHHVRCKGKGRDGFVAIDKAVAKLEHQLEKLKTKMLRQTHGNGEALREVATVDRVSPLVEPDIAQIVKTKSFQIEEMSPEDAVLQMDLLQHDFYFFRNAETGRSAVVYLRHDGNIGLIDESSD
ncbi:MAG: ribosome-associated translation inhibitor RaiA [Acidimicrobiales bacterium]|nr:ribosome-associated translation inhibitor RaiA [Acidimicrobiales bacterium]